MADRYAGTYDSPVGVIHLVGSGGALEGLWLDAARHTWDVEPDEGRLDEVRRQLDEYFAGTRSTFDVELRPTGTPFQREVWEALCGVGYGETASYVDIARKIGRPAASRAVGAANGRNPISIIVPCHRVIGSTGKLVGYGWGVERKQWLLDLEQGRRALLASAGRIAAVLRRIVTAIALRVEDLWQARLARALRRSGRPARVQPFPAFGTAGWARIRGRVLFTSAPFARDPAPTTIGALRANLAQFLTSEVPRARVRVEVGGRSVVAGADREGYLDVLVEEIELPPGRHPYTVTPVDPPGVRATGTLHVPDPAADLVIVSDIDDTIVDSGIAHGLVATVTTALLRHAATRVPLAGAPELSRALARGGAGAHERPFVYLSTSPWNLVEFLLGFLERHGFPQGPLVLTDWGPGQAGFLRIGTRSHKLAALEVLAEAMPGAKFVLIGDSGQEDPEIYGTFALDHPGRVAAVYIRKAGTWGSAQDERLASLSHRLAEGQVALVVAADSAEMLDHAVRAGLTSGEA